MNTSYELLKKYIDITENPIDLADKITMGGPEVEGIEKFAPRIDKVVVGKVVKKEKHPNADKLSVCQVDVNGDKELQIICGAKNHQEGDKVAVSVVGCVLPNGMKIKKAKLRGTLSEGMICSRSELGLEEKSEGVWILDSEAEVGSSIEDYLPKEDTIYDISVTSNRADCLSTLGIAREVGITQNKNIEYPQFPIKESDEINTPNITIEDSELCARYTGRIIKGVEIKESPEWLQEALIKYGSRPINNIVDITNYVMFELGHPLHAFDYNKLEGKKIIVRRAADKEKLTTLDDTEIELSSDNLVIADGKKAVALAGVMGGANSEVSDDTVDILLESAYFLPHNIRKTAKKFGYRTESSYRFERELDPENVTRALDMAASLILELAGGESSAMNDVYLRKIESATIDLSTDFIRQILGFEIEDKEIERLFGLLEFAFTKNGSTYQVTFPSFRQDCHRAIDAVEEIIRAYGYDKVPETMYPIPVTPENFDAHERFEDKVRRILLGLGVNEAYNFSFVNQATAEFYHESDLGKVVTIQNPLNQEYNALRTTILPSMLANLKTNIEHGSFNVALFEIGKVFWKEAELKERKKIGLLLSGKVPADENWITQGNVADFFDLKGIIEELFSGLKKPLATYEKASSKFLHPGKTAMIKINGQEIGIIGELHPDAQEEMGLKQSCVFAELDYELLHELSEDEVRYQSMSKYPAVNREVALLLSNETPADQVLDIIKNESKLVKSASVLDVYTGKPIPEGKKSVAYSFTLQAEDRTLKDDEITAIMDGVITKSKSSLGADLREG